MYETLYGEAPDKLPSVSFIRQCHTVLQGLVEIVAGLRLATAETWDQMFNDATTRCQCEFTALTMGVMGDEYELESIVVSSGILLADSAAEPTVDALFEKVCHA